MLSLNALLWAQPVRINLTVNSDLVDQTNLTSIQTLEKSLVDFLNNTSWTSERGVSKSEIDIDFLLTLSSVNDNSYSGTLQVQSGRLTYNSTYISPLTNFLDTNFNFTYQEFQPFYFDMNRYNNNLVSVFSYYIYLVIGIELDSFSELGGTSYLEQARTIANAAQASKASGWEANQSRKGRFELIDQLSSPAFQDFRKLLYVYHRLALDSMADNPKQTKEVIIDQLLGLENLMRRQPNAYLLQAFFDAKAEEISLIFSDGPEVETEKLIRFLNRFVSSMSSYWSSIAR